MQNNKFVLIIMVLSTMVFSYNATIRWNDVHQRITGFGACSGWGAKSMYGFSEPTRTNCLNDLFDTVNGAGLSMLRNEVPYQICPSAGTYNWGNDAAQVFTMQEAKKRGVTYFWAAPWTPPVWMKTNGSNKGGNLALAHYQDYADFLSKYVTEYENQFQIHMSGISVQNEPHFSPNYSGCEYSGIQIRDFIKNNLGPTFKNNNPNTTIIMPETNWDQRSWADPTLQDTAACKYTGVVALHFYQDDKTATPYPLVKTLKKELWESECSWAGDAGPTMNGAALWFKARHDLLTRAEVNAWHFWWLYDPKPDGEGLMIPGANGGYQTTKRLWTLGNYSKFVRPGWYMMGLPKYYSSDSLLSVSAFRDSSSGKFAIVAANFDLSKGSARRITLNLDGFNALAVTPWLTDEAHDLAKQSDISVNSGSFQVTIPAMTVYTYAGTATVHAATDVKVDSFAVKTEMIIAGQQDTLQWSTGNAASVTIDNGVGIVAANGNAIIAPLATTTYTLTATGAGGPVTRKVLVTVLDGRIPENPSGVNNGLDYTYYETNSNALSDFSSMTPVKSGVLTTFDASPQNKITDLSFQYKGFIDVPVDGVYQFSIKSCSNAALYIGTTQVLLWNYYGGNFGGMGEPVIGTIGLRAGKHAISVGLHHAFGCGAPTIVVNWKVPGQTRTAVPAARIYHVGLPASIQQYAFRKANATLQTSQYDLYNVRGQLIRHAWQIEANGYKGMGVYLAKPNGQTAINKTLLILKP